MKINRKEFIARLIILLIGLTVAHLGVTLFLLSDLGADPFNVLIQGLHKLTAQVFSESITHGMVHMAVCFLIIAVLLIADKSYIKAGTIVCMFFGGPIIDMFTLLLSPLNIGDMRLVYKILILILGCGILAFGMTIVIRSEAGTGPNDLVSVVISDKTKKRFGIVRIITDCVFVVSGAVLGGKFGVGTIICAFLVGTVAEFCMPFSSKLVNRSLKLLKIQVSEEKQSAK